MIRINYGQSTIDHLVKHQMIEIRAGRHDRELRTRHEWHQLSQDKDHTELETALALVNASRSVRSIPCPACQAQPGIGCTSTRKGREGLPTDLHPVRVGLWAGRVLSRYGQLDLSE